MGGQQRQTLGERISARLAQRGARRVRVGPSPTFYARMGMPDPSAPAAAPGGGDFVYVSGSPFYEMMRRLARARLRRQTRLARYERAASRRKLGASRRLWPAQRTRMAHMFGPAVLSESDLVLPEPPPLASEEEVEERGKPRIVDGWTGRVKKAARPSIWHSRATLPAAERADKAAKEQPVQRLSRRLAENAVAKDPIVSAIRASGRPMPRKLVRVIREVEHLPAEEQVRIVRRTVRQMGGSVRVVREQLEAKAPARQASPVSVAVSRMAPRNERRRGLRPVMARSPMMKALAPPQPVAPELQEARGQAPPRVSPWKSQPRAARTASRATTTASSATRTARAPRRSPTRSTPAARPRASADAGLEGPPPPSALSPSQPAARTASSAHLAARAVMAAEPAARGRSVLPRVTPVSAARAPSFRTPQTESAPVGAVRAARRVQIGLSRPNSVLPRITAPDANTEAAAPAPRPRRAEPARGRTRRMAAVFQAPSAQVIAPPEVAGAAEPAEAAAQPRRSAWKSSVRPVQQAARRVPVVRETRSLVPRPAPRVSADAPQRIGTARRALVRQQSTEPVGRSVLPRLTRAAAPLAPRRPARRPGVAPTALPDAAPGTSPSSPSPAQLAATRTETAPEAVRAARPRRMRAVAPSEILPAPLRPEATPEAAVAAAAPVRSAWGPSPGQRASAPQRPEPSGPTDDVSVTPARRRAASASPVRAAVERMRAVEGAEQGSLLPRLRAEAPIEAEKARPVRAALARQESAQPREGSILPRATRKTAEVRQRRPRRMQAIAPSAVDIQPEAARAEAAAESAPATRRSAWGPSPGRTQVVASRSASSAQQEQARQVARRASSAAGSRPMEKAALRSSKSPLVGYSARKSQGKRPVASVDVKLRRSAPGPISYARGTQTIYVELPPEPAPEPPPAAPKPKKAAPAATAPRRAPSIFDVGAPVKRPAPAPKPTPEPQEPARRVVRRRVGPAVRPLDRIGVRGEEPEAAEGLLTRRGAWSDGRTLLGERSLRSPRLWTGPDGVVVQAPADAPEAEVDAAQAPRRSAWVSPRTAPPSGGRGVPAPWSRPVWTRGRQARPSSRLPQGELSRAARTARGVYVSQRVARSAAPVRDFQYPNPAAASAAPEGEGSTRRPPLPWTLEAVDARSDNRALPGWAQRASEKPRITGSDDLLRQLAGAREVSEVVRVIFERSGESAPLMRQVSSPVLQVIQQIRSEAHKAGEAQEAPAQRTVTATASGGGPRKAMRRGGPQPSMQQVVRGMTGLRTMASAPKSEGVGEDKVSKLARRLRELIHLAEVKNQRDQARQGVRMAEDSASARAEGQAAPTDSEGNSNTEQVDIDALAREVLDHVQREQQLRQERRIDGGDSGDFWW